MKHLNCAHRMLLSMLGAFVASSGASLATELTVKNDLETDGSTATPCHCLIAGESVAAWLTAPVYGNIVAVQVLWKSAFGGAPDSQEME